MIPTADSHFPVLRVSAGARLALGWGGSSGQTAKPLYGRSLRRQRGG